MRLTLLTILVMIAFAANSVLNRMALIDGETGPAAFALVRLAAGTLMLLALAYTRGAGVTFAARNRVWGVITLATYVLGFSFAYVSLEAGTGALILFGGVQITMFIGAVLQNERIIPARWFGAFIAFTGLLVLLWPDADVSVNITGAILMAIAAIGWGCYSLLGRSTSNPLGSTAANFTLALPIGIACFAFFPDTISPPGAILACISGAVTSGLGYALWYSVLPKLQTSVAAIAQLSVPIIAVCGGMIFVGEPITLRFVIATALVLSGVLLGLRRQGRSITSNGS